MDIYCLSVPGCCNQFLKVPFQTVYQAREGPELQIAGNDYQSKLKVEQNWPVQMKSREYSHAVTVGL